MGDRIEGLNDATAKAILAKVAGSLAGNLQKNGIVTEWAPGMEAALRDAFGIGALPAAVTEGDLARQALMLLADDPTYLEPICALIEGPAIEHFGFAGAMKTVALIMAVLLVLQTHVRFERDKTGKYEILIEKQPTSTELLKPLVEKLLSRFPE